MVKEVSGKIDDLVKKKEYLEAAGLIVNALQLLLTDLLDISALSDLLQTIMERKNVRTHTNNQVIITVNICPKPINRYT